jgi:pentatricopeptide repeat protein
VARKKNSGQKRARKVQARKKKQQQKVKQANAQEFATLAKPMVEDDRDRASSDISLTQIPDRRVLERDMANALGLDGDMTAEEAEADALFYQAMDATNAEARVKTLEAALAKNPRHIDAIVELAQLYDDDNTAFLFLSRAIEFGEEDLEDELRNDAGHFWGLHHTRPFMRAKQAIAERYFEAEELINAAYEMEEMLRLNPNDNQGMRWMLMEVYCRMDRLDDAERLLREYPEDGMPFLPFTGLLIRFRKVGDSPELRISLREQADWNPHIVPRLLEPSLISHEVYTTFSPRSPEEADLYCQQFLSV